MSFGGGGGGNTTSTTTNEPWPGIQDELRRLFARGENLADQPINPLQMLPQDRLHQFMQFTGAPNMQYFTNRGYGDVRSGINTGIVPFAPDELRARGMIEDLAGQGPNPLLTQGGQSAMQIISQRNTRTPGYSVLSDLSQQQLAPEAQHHLENIYQQPLSHTAGYNPTQTTVSGQYLTPDSNPFLKQMAEAAGRPVIEQFQADVLPSIRSQFSMSGHTPGGSSEGFEVGRATDRLAQTLADQSANLYGQAYGQERGLQENAINRLVGMGQTQGRLGLDAANSLADIAARQGALQLGAGTGLVDLAQGQDRLALGALGLLPGLVGQQYAMDVNNIGLLGQAGGAQRDLTQQLIGQQGPLMMAPWEQTQLLSGVLQPGLNFNTSTQSTPYHQNQLAGMLGGGLSGAGLGAMVGGPIGAGIGGLGGLLLGGLF